jgi:hypothetical protein
MSLLTVIVKFMINSGVQLVSSFINVISYEPKAVFTTLFEGFNFI